MKRSILRSSEVNCDALYNARSNCLPEHHYLILYYWNYKYVNNIKHSLYWENNKINKESIMETLTK